MKQLLLIIFLAATSTTSLGQYPKANTYLVIRFQETLNYNNERNDPFYFIVPEGGNPNAAEIYRLISYKSGPFDENTGGSFFYGEIDTSARYYNYFNTHTAGMEYLAKREWQLVTVISEIYTQLKSESADGRYYPVPVVLSRPVYYFKKEIK